ncbi:MAG: hypothetical protein ABIJ37_09145 [Pseudomonadota bacterium]
MDKEIKKKQEERFKNTENMEQRYRAWALTLGGHLVNAVRIGQELGGEQFMQKLEKTFFEGGKAHAQRLKQTAKLGESWEPLDCLKIGFFLDAIDDSFANFWEGYVEKTPKAFEKCVLTCPVAELFTQAPVICERLIQSGAQGMVKALNPKASFRFKELLPNGDDSCCYRVEITG